MFILIFLISLASVKYFSRFISEPLAMLIFGVALFSAVAVLRPLLKRQKESSEKKLSEMEKAVVVNES